jgi:CRISPR-associated endonuclease/helicase Cas3
LYRRRFLSEKKIKMTTPAPIKIDVAFQTSAQGSIPQDHGYSLLAALSHLDQRFHGADWLAIHPIAGQPLGGTMVLRPRVSALRLRVPPDRIPEVLVLAGKTLVVAGTRLLLGVSQLYMLRPAAQLASRMVTLKGYTEPGPFEERVKKELESRDIKAAVEVGRRRIVTVAGDKVVGFGLRLSGLSDEDSLAIQYAGIGGRQRFGCGIFGPATRSARGAQ